MRRSKSTKPLHQINIAKERIEKLLNLSKENLDLKPERSRRYVKLARKIGLRYNVRLSRTQKKNFCKECDTYLVPGKTMTVRIVDGEPLKKCFTCGNKIN